MTKPDPQVEAAGSSVQTSPTEEPAATPAAPVETPPVREARVDPSATDPQSRKQESAPLSANSNPQDWGDENKLIQALRADWQSSPIARSFGIGEQVPSDIPLKPLPPSVASRDQGVNMHYFIADGDAVLVLPQLRVVVEVYHPSSGTGR